MASDLPNIPKGNRSRYHDMGITRRWFRDRAFLLTTLSGSINNRSLMAHVHALNRESEGTIGLKECLDCRGLHDITELSVEGVTQAGSSERKKPGSRLVILVPKDVPVIYGLARAYEMFAADHRKMVRVCTDVDDAVRWLEPDETSAQFLLECLSSESSLPQSVGF